MNKKGAIPMNKSVAGLRGRRLMEVLARARPASLDSATVQADAIAACLAAAAAAPPARATRLPQSAPAQHGAAGLRRWPGWLVPVAAAAAVAAVITASLAISSGIARRTAGAGSTARASAVFAQVPRYFVALWDSNDSPGPAVVGATATGAVLGTVAPPKQYPLFTMVAAGGDDRTFVFAAVRGVRSSTDPAPVQLYRLVLRRSGHPGRLTPLPIPPVTGGISGLAVSPDGSKLAVSVLGSGNAHDPSKIEVFSLATGAERDWAWPGAGWIEWTMPLGVDEFAARSLSWEADNRTLLFEVRIDTIPRTAQARLLDTAAPGGSLLASSTRVPIPGAELSPWGRKNPPVRITGPLLITGDGTRIAAPTSHVRKDGSGATTAFDVTITEFSVRTGKPVQVLYRQRFGAEPDGSEVLWVNASGTAMIVGRDRPLPGPNSHTKTTVIGVQTRATFTPLPPGVQHYFLTGQPTW